MGLLILTLVNKADEKEVKEFDDPEIKLNNFEPYLLNFS